MYFILTSSNRKYDPFAIVPGHKTMAPLCVFLYPYKIVLTPKWRAITYCTWSLCIQQFTVNMLNVLPLPRPIARLSYVDVSYDVVSITHMSLTHTCGGSFLPSLHTLVNSTFISSQGHTYALEYICNIVKIKFDLKYRFFKT